MDEELDKRARTIQKVLREMGWDSDIPSLVKRVNQLDKGLAQEDEFAFILSWSDRCIAIHKLNQEIAPAKSKNKFTIPDLFVLLKHEDIAQPFFIEVKTSEADRLSWTDQYYQGLLSYSSITGIPILIAWKWVKFDIWALFDLNKFQKGPANFKIDLNTAHTESLMSKLAGDYLIKPYDQIGFHIKFKKQELIKKNHSSTEYNTVVEKIYFSGDDGKEIENIDVGIFSYLMSLPMDDSIQETETHIIQSFIPNPNKSAFAQTVPVRLVKAFSKNEVNWWELAKTEKFPIKYNTLYRSLEKGIHDGIIRNILFMKPKSEG